MANSRMQNQRTYGSRPAPRERKSPVKRVLIVIVVVIVACAAALGVLTVMGFGPFAKYTIPADARIIMINGSSATASSSEAQSSEPQASTIDFAFNAESLSKLPSSQALQGFSLSSLSAPVLTEGNLAKLNQTGGACLQQGGVSFILLNLQTGRGISYNQDSDFYSAASFGAIYSCYLCEEIFDKDRASRSEAEELVGKVISQGDVSALKDLRAKYDSYGWGDYAEALGLGGISELGDAPSYSVHSAALQWAHVRQYLFSGASNASWLSGLLGSGSDVLIRSCLSDEEGVSITNCGGFASGDSGCICDCGLISLSGESYLLCVMTGLSDSADNLGLVKSMTTELLALRSHLGE